MSVAPAPPEIFQRAIDEGERRLDQSLLELVSTSFIAGFTVVFGIIALATVHTLAEPLLGQAARIAGALAFGIGFVFLIIGKAELFSENFFDPTATALERRGTGMRYRLLRLWGVTFALNLVGGVLFTLPLAVPGALPEGTGHTLRKIAEESAAQGALAIFASAIVGGALVALQSFLQQAVDSVGSRISLALMVGFLLAVGPFAHVIVTVLHLVLGLLFGAALDLRTFAVVMAAATAGNLVGGIGLVTLSHIAQAEGARDRDN